MLERNFSQAAMTDGQTEEVAIFRPLFKFWSLNVFENDKNTSFYLFHAGILRNKA